MSLLQSYSPPFDSHMNRLENQMILRFLYVPTSKALTGCIPWN